jgi:integral membrane protein (TIGR01906 family)
MTTHRKDLPTQWIWVLRNLIQGIIPILLLLGTVRLILVTTDIWIPIEYRMPGFPDDPYGFSLEDRLKWSAIDVQYLLNDAGIEYFDSFQLGEGEPMHNDRELRHMQDVKVLVQQSWLAFRIGFVLLIFLLLILGGDQGYDAAWDSLQRGFLWTLVLLGILVIGIAVGFGILFVGFHKIFFEGETWIFKFSDTFIRLYPERFWRDVFIFLTVLTAAEAGLFYWLTGKVNRRNKKKESSA